MTLTDAVPLCAPIISGAYYRVQLLQMGEIFLQGFLAEMFKIKIKQKLCLNRNDVNDSGRAKMVICGCFECTNCQFCCSGMGTWLTKIHVNEMLELKSNPSLMTSSEIPSANVVQELRVIFLFFFKQYVWYLVQSIKVQDFRSKGSMTNTCVKYALFGSLTKLGHLDQKSSYNTVEKPF